MAEIISWGGRGKWPARVGGAGGGAMAGLSRGWPSGRSRALEDKPRALGHSGAQGKLT